VVRATRLSDDRCGSAAHAGAERRGYVAQALATAYYTVGGAALGSSAAHFGDHRDVGRVVGEGRDSSNLAQSGA
jgi:hypothetical protein